MAISPISISLSVVGQSAVASAFSSVSSSAQGMASNVTTAGAQAAAGLTPAQQAAANLTSTLQGVRTAGLAIGAAGAGALILATSLSDAFLEADRLNGRMQALLSSKGLSGASDDIKKLSGDLAGLTGGDDDEIAAQLSSAIVSGRVNGLKELGIALSANALAEIDRAGKVSASAKSQEILTQVLGAGSDAVKTMTANLDPSTVAVGVFNNRWNNLAEDVGKGASASRAAILGGILNPVMDVIDQNPGLKETAGTFLYLGGSAASIVGTVLSVGSQAVLTAGALATMGAQGALSFAAIQAGAIAAAASMTPLLLIVGKIALVAILAAAAIYGLDNLMHKKEDAELKANIAAGEAGDEERLKRLNDNRAKQGKTEHDRTPISMAQLKAFEADESGSMDPLGKQRGNTDFDPEALKAELTGALSPSGGGAALSPTYLPIAPMPFATPAISTGMAFAPPRGSGGGSGGGPDVAQQIGQQIAMSLLGGGQIGGGFSGASTRQGRATEAGGSREGEREITARIGRQSQSAGGKVLVQFEQIEIDTPGLASYAGGY